MEGYPQVVAGVVRPGRFERPTFCSPMLFARSVPAFCCFPVRSILSIPPGRLDGAVDGVLNLLGLADNNCLRRRPHTPDFTRSSLFSSSFLAPAYFSRSATDNLANQHSVPPRMLGHSPGCLLQFVYLPTPRMLLGYPLSTLTITLLFQFPGLNGCFSLWLGLWLVVARLYSPKRPLINSAPDVFGQSQPVFLGRGPPFGQVRALDAQA